jgi:deoxyribose-phosphate aldolase
LSAPYSYRDIARLIDHSILSPAATTQDLETGCRVGREYDVASVCLLPYFVKRCAELLAGSPVQPCTVIGFPHGAHATSIKLAEVAQALKDGATEVDAVTNISKARSGDWDYVRREIQELTAAARAGQANIKIIFENAYLDEASKIRLCEICGEIGVNWVKTSTGFASSGATVADVALMRKHSPPRVQVKASGGIRSLDTLLEMRAAGATRIGTSSTAQILDEYQKRFGAETTAETAVRR